MDKVQMEELTVPEVEAAMVLLRVGLLLPQAQLEQEVPPMQSARLLSAQDEVQNSPMD